jgi:hypothetical protein
MAINKPIPIVQKTYTTPFLLDRAKVSRILNVLEERFEHLKLAFDPRYHVRFLRGNELFFNHIEDVLALDNTTRNPIELLMVEAKGKMTDGTIGMICKVSFAAQREYAYKNIEVYVSCTDAKLALQAFAALEEQVQRSFLDDWIYRFFKGGKDFSPLLIGVLTAIPLLYSLGNSFGNQVSNQEYKRLLSGSRHASSVEQKIDFLFEIAKQEAESKYAAEAGPQFSSIFSLKMLLLMLPIVIVIGCVYYVVSKCYPTSIFLWGDYESHYNNLVARRNTIWTVVVLSLILGLVTNFFAIGLSGLIKLD